MYLPYPGQRYSGPLCYSYFLRGVTLLDPSLHHRLFICCTHTEKQHNFTSTLWRFISFYYMVNSGCETRDIDMLVSCKLKTSISRSSLCPDDGIDVTDISSSSNFVSVHPSWSYHASTLQRQNQKRAKDPQCPLWNSMIITDVRLMASQN